MDERVYDLPEDVARAEGSPSAAGAELRTAPNESAMLWEMNAKLDAILATLSERGA